ncbi:MAG: hypothetical protein ACQEWW_26195 [Bacillota bacterium]
MFTEVLTSITRPLVIGIILSAIFGFLFKLVLIVGLEMIAGLALIPALLTLPALFTSSLILLLIIALIVFLLNKKWFTATPKK